MGTQQQQLRLFDFLPADWSLQFEADRVVLLAPNCDEARYLLNGAKKSLHCCANRIGTVIDIVAFGAIQPLASFAAKVRPTLTAPLHEILPPFEDPEWFTVANALDVPVWLFDHFDVTTLWANKAALQPQAKSKEEIIGKDGSSLDKPEELERIANYLEADGSIDAMEFNGYRWGRMAENSRIYTRIEHTFVEHWKLIDWQDKPVRLGVVLQTQPV